jgi:hypothetical protein
MNLKYTLFLVLVSFIGISSCNNDDKNNIPESAFVTYHPTADDVVVGQAMFTTNPPLEVQGRAIVYKNSFHHVLRFENFSMENGSDLSVYLSKANNNTDEYINLGPLIASSGSFNYTYSSNTNMGEFKHIIVYNTESNSIFCVASL